MLVWESFTNLAKSANKVKIYFFADFLLKKIGTHIIPEMERKCTPVKLPRGYAVEKAKKIGILSRGM